MQTRMAHLNILRVQGGGGAGGGVKGHKTHREAVTLRHEKRQRGLLIVTINLLPK